MFNKLSCFWRVLPKEYKRKILSLQITVVAISIFELVTIAMIAGFMGIVSDKDKLINFRDMIDGFINFRYENESLLLLLSVVVLFLLSTSSMFSLLMTKRINTISVGVGHKITLGLFRYYQRQDWIFFVRNNTSRLQNNILTESTRLVMNVIIPVVNIISRLAFIILILLSIIYYDAVTSLLIMFFFVACYTTVSRVLRGKLVRNGKVITESNKNKYKVSQETFINAKTSILLGKESYFYDEFEKSNFLQSMAQASTKTIALGPKFMMEWLAYTTMITIIIVNIIIFGDSFATVLPLLTVYGLAAFKLLPSMQQIYNNLAMIKGNISALDVLFHDLKASFNLTKDDVQVEITPFDRSLEVVNGSFSYNDSKILALQDINIRIRKFEKIGFVGHSGSGKSTLVDILCGLLKLDSGTFNVDDKELNDVASWYPNISYVPQTVSFLDATLAENIAFGVSYDDIKWEQLSMAIELSSLSDLVERLPDGVNSKLGENGVQISGGQRQRIGIARALYTKSDILIFDEATSALDGITENQIMDSIENLSGKKTIIMIAHRLKTIRNCDRIYLMEKGKVVDEGSYEELLMRNSNFREMDKFS